jgi:hypothetical protein
MFFSFIAEEFGAEDDKCGPDSLAVFLEEVGTDFRDELVGRAGKKPEHLLNLLQVFEDIPVKIEEGRVFLHSIFIKFLV